MAALLCFCIIPERRGGTRGGVTIARPAAVAPTPPPTISDPCAPYELKVGHGQYRQSHRSFRAVLRLCGRFTYKPTDKMR